MAGRGGLIFLSYPRVTFPIVNMTGYLARLGVRRPTAPSIPALRALHKAHVERVAYETFDMYLGRPPGIDPVAAAGRIAAGRGGFCYHLNGAFSLLLRALGFSVTWHRAGVQSRDRPPAITDNHLALTVDRLPGPECPDGRWFVDVGLGDALHEPLPLRQGDYRQGPFGYTLRPSDVAPGGWRFDHDPRGSFAGVDIAPEPAKITDFAEMSRWLSTSPESSFVRLPVTQRRDADGIDILTGCVLTRIDATGKHRSVVDRPGRWFELLANRFELVFVDYDAPTRAKLWDRVAASHREYLASAPASDR